MRFQFAHLAAAATTVLALFTATAANAQLAVTGSGARGTITQSLAFNAQAALLNSFDLSFGFGNDHHIRRVRAMPAEASNSVGISYYDNNADDAFAWRASFFPLNNSAMILNELSGSCAGTCTTTLPVPAGYTFVLRGFDTQFNSDHKIKTLGVEHGGSTLRVYMADINGDDQFAWRVRYALVPAAAIATSGNASGNGSGSSQAAITSGKTVLRGFMFHFSSDDHNISRVAVRPNGATLGVSYLDQNGDDGFSWRVQWANLR